MLLRAKENEDGVDGKWAGCHKEQRPATTFGHPVALLHPLVHHLGFGSVTPGRQSSAATPAQVSARTSRRPSLLLLTRLRTRPRLLSGSQPGDPRCHWVIDELLEHAQTDLAWGRWCRQVVIEVEGFGGIDDVEGALQDWGELAGVGIDIWGRAPWPMAHSSWTSGLARYSSSFMVPSGFAASAATSQPSTGPTTADGTPSSMTGNSKKS